MENTVSIDVCTRKTCPSVPSHPSKITTDHIRTTIELQVPVPVEANGGASVLSIGICICRILIIIESHSFAVRFPRNAFVIHNRNK